MARFGFVWLLLINYLLVVGAGLVNRPEQPRYSAAHPYVHSKDCQQKHYLRLDCFDQCNGDQHALQKRPSHPSPQQLLSMAKGIDLHCLSEEVAVQPIFLSLESVAPTAEKGGKCTGFQADFYPPPRRG